MGGTGPESVPSTNPTGIQIHAASTSQPSCAKSPDEEIEYLRTLAKVIARGRGGVARPLSSARSGPSATTQMTSSVLSG